MEVIMESSQYQSESNRTAPSRMTKPNKLTMFTIGLFKSVGKLAHLSLDCPLEEPKKMEEELGDIIWYVTNIASLYSLNLDTIMDKNLEKLWKKYPSGYEKKKT
jgi:NTP pyrophosphatase (non-canonical NTP hydrolase)